MIKYTRYRYGNNSTSLTTVLSQVWPETTKSGPGILIEIRLNQSSELLHSSM